MMKIQFLAYSLLLAGTMTVLTGCSSTRFVATWKEPDASLAHINAGSKVGAMVVHPDLSLRRSAEDALAAELTQRGLQGIPSYSILGDPSDEASAKEAFKQAGAVAVVVMRGMGENIEVDYRPPTYYYGTPAYSSFWGGYYGQGWKMAYDPGYLRTTRVVSVETLVYDLGSNKLVWGGRSKTVDPTQLDKFMKEVMDAATEQMRKQGVIQPRES